MAEVIRKATNKWTKGLVMDFSPENTQNELLTHALNATLLTFNGNELSLQNDMGNARVETAYLPEGYMPVGTCEYGGIIYIVSYNPLEDKSQIGCFPSPERNISNKELGVSNCKIENSSFQDELNPGKLKNNTQYVLLRNSNLNPGDKFLICSDEAIYDEQLKDLRVKHGEDLIPVDNPILALNVVSIEDSGKIVYLNSDILHYEVTTDSGTYNYHILGKMTEDNEYNQDSVDIDEYRNVLSSGYSVFKSKTSGKLAILAELITIDSYSVTHQVVPRKDSKGNIEEGNFDIIISTDITPEVTSSNYNTVPKLQYYYLKNSQGYLQVPNLNYDTTIGETENTKVLFRGGAYNVEFLNTSLNSVYIQTIDDATLMASLNQSISTSGKFNFPKADTYHGRMLEFNGDIEDNINSIYTKFYANKFHRISKSQIENNLDYYNNDIGAKFYIYDDSAIDYQESIGGEVDDTYIYYIKTTTYTYTDALRNEIYKNDTLYKIISEPLKADDTIMQDSTIEKYRFETIISYREVVEYNYNGTDTLYTKNGNDYTSVTGEVDWENNTYYTEKREQNLVSVGFTPNEGSECYYYPSTKNYTTAIQKEVDSYYDFDTYPIEAPITLYVQNITETFEEATEEQIANPDIKLYYKKDYTLIDPRNANDSLYQLFMVVYNDTYVGSDKFVPNVEYNYIENYTKPTGGLYPEDGYPKDDPISLYTIAAFIPEAIETTESIPYDDLKLAHIKIPHVVSSNGLDLPFKYDYTLVPCMQYGRLDNLAVSGTVDFSKLHAFNQSNYTTWKYHIDENQLRLTFGAEIFDTYEDKKVDALILEFYDLWGFAGSIEITDKKSYSGIFTKIIQLNTLNALSKKKVNGNTYSTSYIHNIGIQEKNNKLQYNDQEVELENPYNGWSNISVENNDCGTLYSNILYGVKTYIRRTTDIVNNNTIYEFIPKKDFFLFTIPLYNDYYYSVDDFTNLKNPKLDLMLTYKLVDNSNMTAYNQEGVIENGYTIARDGVDGDSELLTQYLSGFYNDTSLDLIKYYQYKGVTNVYLEVGLKQDYEKIGLSYDKSINKLFSCTLELISNSIANAAYEVTSEDGLSVESNILNYDKRNVNFEGLNEIGFEDGNRNKFVNNIEEANFLTYTGNQPIQIKYNFVVGYSANISDIRNSQVPATTVCALCHKDSEGEYNYEDFGVYEQTINDVPYFLSDVMFYNTGGCSGMGDSEFGVCKQINISGNIEQQCTIIDNTHTEAVEIKNPGFLNTTTPLKSMISHIGKLTFCQPHAHGLSSDYGVNIHEQVDNLSAASSFDDYGIPPEIGEDVMVQSGNISKEEADDAGGTNPRLLMYENPRYNSCLNTKNSVDYSGEFISTLDYYASEGRVAVVDWHATPEMTWHTTTMRRFTGFSGEEVATFNEKLVQTMKGIYAYNPDYDQITVNIGNISLQKYNPKFISNLLSKNATLNFPPSNEFNDYIYFGTMQVSNYLQKLTTNSVGLDNTSIKTTYKNGNNKEVVIEQLKFEPSYTYCGDGSNYCLLTSLTYNTPVPSSLENELEFTASDMIVVKHEDGTNTFLSGKVNKKALYGYNNDFKKMIQLDVSNYQIDSDGTLKVASYADVDSSIKTFNLTSANVANIFTENACYFNCEYQNTETSETDNIIVTLNVIVGIPHRITSDNFGVFYYGDATENISIKSNIRVSCSAKSSKLNSDYAYSVKLKEIQLKGNTCILNDKIDTEDYYSNNPRLDYQSASVLNSLLNNTGQVTLIDMSGNAIMNTNTEVYQAFNYQDTDIYVNDKIISNYAQNITGLNYSTEMLTFSTVDNLADPKDDYAFLTRLSKLEIKSITVEITQKSRLSSITESFISSTRTSKYSKIVDKKYKVLDIFTNAQFKGTSLTINDLTYEPNKEGHRLFVRNGLCSYNETYRGKLYYRYSKAVNIFEKGQKDWDTWDRSNKLKNALFLYTGPCFTISNLYE